MGGHDKCLLLMTRGVGGSKKPQKPANVIHGCSLNSKFIPASICFCKCEGRKQNFRKCNKNLVLTYKYFYFIFRYVPLKYGTSVCSMLWFLNRILDLCQTRAQSKTLPDLKNYLVIANFSLLKVSKSQNIFFLKLHCPKNERNI